jgi:hypothetical protein
MASTIKVDNIQDQCGSAVVTKCGASKTLTVTTTKADNYQAADGGNIINQCGTTITLGASGDTITLACGASQTGFGRTGTVDWDTTAKTASFTAVSGNGYFVNTTSGAITVTLPATPSAGDIVSIADYTNTFQTNNVTVARNGSPIGGISADAVLSTEGQSVTFIYVDGTEGWKNVQDSTSNVTGNPYIVATGGTVTCCGDYKIHIFTGPGTFCISRAATCAADNAVEYLVVAGGAGAGADQGGGGGAGGFRSFTDLCGTNSPLNAPAGLTVTASPYPITVGGGGTAGSPSSKGGPGSNSIFSTITSTGGGGAGTYNPVGPVRDGLPGGSGGGAGGRDLGTAGGGSGNTPPVSPPQGNNGGGIQAGGDRGAGGGGAGAAGVCSVSTGAAGSFIQTGFIGPLSPSYGESGPAGRYFSGGGAGRPACGGGTDQGGIGGGGNTYNPGDVNTGGGGGFGDTPGGTVGTGGSGIVIIRYKYQ